MTISKVAEKWTFTKSDNKWNTSKSSNKWVTSLTKPAIPSIEGLVYNNERLNYNTVNLIYNG